MGTGGFFLGGGEGMRGMEREGGGRLCWAAGQLGIMRFWLYCLVFFLSLSIACFSLLAYLPAERVAILMGNFYAHPPHSRCDETPARSFSISTNG